MAASENLDSRSEWAQARLSAGIGFSQHPGSNHPEKPKGLRDRNSPSCTLSQNGYGAQHCKHNICAKTKSSRPSLWYGRPPHATQLYVGGWQGGRRAKEGEKVRGWECGIGGRRGGPQPKGCARPMPGAVHATTGPAGRASATPDRMSTPAPRDVAAGKRAHRHSGPPLRFVDSSAGGKAACWDAWPGPARNGAACKHKARTLTVPGPWDPGTVTAKPSVGAHGRKRTACKQTRAPCQPRDLVISRRSI